MNTNIFASIGLKDFVNLYTGNSNIRSFHLIRQKIFSYGETKRKFSRNRNGSGYPEQTAGSLRAFGFSCMSTRTRGRSPRSVATITITPTMLGHSTSMSTTTRATTTPTSSLGLWPLNPYRDSKQLRSVLATTFVESISFCIETCSTIMKKIMLDMDRFLILDCPCQINGKILLTSEVG